MRKVEPSEPITPHCHPYIRWERQHRLGRKVAQPCSLQWMLTLISEERFAKMSEDR